MLFGSSIRLSSSCPRTVDANRAQMQHGISQPLLALYTLHGSEVSPIIEPCGCTKTSSRATYVPMRMVYAEQATNRQRHGNDETLQGAHMRCPYSLKTRHIMAVIAGSIYLHTHPATWSRAHCSRFHRLRWKSAPFPGSWQNFPAGFSSRALPCHLVPPARDRLGGTPAHGCHQPRRCPRTS